MTDERERTGTGVTAQTAAIQGLSSEDPRRDDMYNTKSIKLKA